MGKAKGGDRGPDCGPSACAPTLADAAVAVEGAKKLKAVVVAAEAVVVVVVVGKRKVGAVGSACVCTEIPDPESGRGETGTRGTEARETCKKKKQRRNKVLDVKKL